MAFPRASQALSRFPALDSLGQPVTLSRTASRMAARPPEFGERTDEVLAEFEFSADEIDALEQRKATCRSGRA